MRPYDENQRAAVSARANTVVRAGAGAGKTSVLAGRYLRLVADAGIPVDRILTLTFTRKAAAEMHDRIYRMLSEVRGSEFVTEQLQRFDTAVISTLDSFCATVARSGCAAFGVSPQFTVDEMRLDRFCRDLALRFLLDRRDDPVVKALVRLNLFERLWQDGFVLLARDHFSVTRPFESEQMVRAQRAFLSAELERLTGTLMQLLRCIRGLDPNASSCIAGAQEIIERVDASPLVEGDLRRRLAAAGDEPLDGSTAELVRVVEDALAGLRGVGKRCGSSKRPEIAEYKGLVDELRATLDHLTELIRTWRSWHAIAAAAQLAGDFRALVVAEKRRTGLLSYHDVMALAIAVLTRDTELRAYYKRRFLAVMIDEFQDNNEDQKQLLYLLAEREGREGKDIPRPEDLHPDKLFFVGDEKQSIYRFRGADVSVFRRLSEELGGEDATVALHHNYRSEPGLISFFNALFPLVFAEPREVFEARFEPLQSRDPTPGLTPTVQLWEIENRDGDSSLVSNNEAEAYHLARFIRESVDGGALPVPAKPADSGSGGADRPAVRPVRYEDFAILMRSSSNQMLVERMLRLMGVPYVAQTARSLFLEAPVNDVYNALQLLLYPQDRVALAAYLRSPLVGMSDDGVIRVLAAEVELFGPVAGLTSEDGARYARGAERHADLRQRADTERLTDLLHHIWYRLGYRYHLLRRPEHAAYLEYYDYIYELARQHEEQGLAAFLDRIRLHLGSSERLTELDILREGEAGVQLMTIHKAKGLEFPVVVVANAGNPGRGSSVSAVPFHWSQHLGLVWNIGDERVASAREQAINYVYRAEQEEAQRQETAELKRLLYVAATRAETHLIFSGVQNGKSGSLLSLLSAPFVAAMSQLVTAGEVTVVRREMPAVPREQVWREGDRARGRDIADLAVRYASRTPMRRRANRHVFSVTDLNAAWLAARADTVPAGVVVESPARLFVDEHAGSAADSGLAEAFGTFTHYCIEQLGGGRRTVAELSDLARLPASVRPPLDGKAFMVFATESIDLAQRFLASETWDTLCKQTPPEFEVPFLLRLDPGHVSAFVPDAASPVHVRGQMDLVFALPDRVVVIDFKTDRVLHSDHYTLQMDLYRRAASSIFGRPAETVLYHLRTGTAVPAEESAITATNLVHE